MRIILASVNDCKSWILEDLCQVHLLGQGHCDDNYLHVRISGDDARPLHLHTHTVTQQWIQGADRSVSPNILTLIEKYPNNTVHHLKTWTPLQALSDIMSWCVEYEATFWLKGTSAFPKHWKFPGGQYGHAPHPVRQSGHNFEFDIKPRDVRPSIRCFQTLA